VEKRELKTAFVTSAGAYLPGEPVTNEQIEQRLGLVGNKASRLRRRILESNGILTRHYAIDAEGQPTHLNEELAAAAVKNALTSRGLGVDDVAMLAFGTTIPDVLIPGFATMVHGRLGGGVMECLSAGGVCSSGIGALRAAVNAVRVGDHQVAVAGGSELASQLMKSSRFEAEKVAPEREDAADSFQYFNADFLRWMLSDGAGAVVIEPKPRADGLSLQVEWIELSSYAHKYETCMYLGLSDPTNPRVGKTFLGPQTFADAEREGMFIIRQDTRLLAKAIPEVVGAEAKRLHDAGKLRGEEIDWFLPHLSSYFFHGVLERTLIDAGVPIPTSKWFTNLKTKGNTGAASFYIILQEAMSSGMLKVGQRVLAMIPESGRFTVAYALFTVVGPQ
jgi:3-oxoacyl-[acyl-carrier-protein] synthase-3